MKAVILAGGAGTRLGAIAKETPKPLIKIGGKPLINHNLGLLVRHGADRVSVVVRRGHESHYGKWHSEFAGAFPGTRIEIVAEPEPMGTFGYIAHYLKHWVNGEDFFVTNGDEIKDIDLVAMREKHKKTTYPVTIALMKMEQPDDYGTVRMEGERVAEFLEKKIGAPPSLVSAGLYLISGAALESISHMMPTGKTHLMFEKDLFPILAARGELGGFVAGGTFLDCGTPERLERAIREA